METKKLYLYWSLEKNSKFQSSQTFISPHSENDGVFVSHRWPVLGLDTSIWRGQKIIEAEKEYSIKQFHIHQKNFDKFLFYSSDLGIRILKITFEGEFDDEEWDDLAKVLRKNDPVEMMNYARFQRNELGRDIREITFIFDSSFGKQITFSKEGVITFRNEENEIANLLETVPMGILSGVYLPENSVRSE